VTRTAWDAEVARVNVLRGLDLLDTEPEDRFDRITRLVQETLDVPMAYGPELEKASVPQIPDIVAAARQLAKSGTA